jgi:tripartite-type tricarboxylate transporter receptor subunit TctC
VAEKDEDSLDLAGSISEITQDAVSNLDEDSEKSQQENESQEKSKTESSSPTDDTKESTEPEAEELIEDLQQIYKNKGWLPGNV